jgi:pentatricopeptide repeat protein
MGIRPNAVLYNAILLGLCKRRETHNAIDLFAYMISNGCMPNESTYTILLEGLAYEGLAKEARELLGELCSRGVVNKKFMKKGAIKMLDGPATT